MITLIASSGAFSLSGSEVNLQYKATQVLALRVRLQAARSSSSYCLAQATTTWFPIAPGIAAPVAAPAPIVNENPKPPNAVEAPEDFDTQNPNLCFLFQDLLPTGVAPICPLVQEAQFLTQPYNEITKSIALVRSFISVESLNYPLNLETRTAILSTRPALQSINIQIVANLASFAMIGQIATLQYIRTLFGNNGKFILGRPEQSLRKDWKLTAEAGTIGLSASDASLGILIPEQGLTALSEDDPLSLLDF